MECDACKCGDMPQKVLGACGWKFQQNPTESHPLVVLFVADSNDCIFWLEVLGCVALAVMCFDNVLCGAAFISWDNVQLALPKFTSVSEAA